MADKIVMIAGPNGAGKTTTAMSFISSEMVDEYVNADEIARGLAPLHPESVSLTASKLLLKRIKDLLDTRESFAFETTCAGTNYVKHLKQAQDIGYEVCLLFLWLSSPNLAVERVANRVKQGGHNIPEEVIRRRYFSGIRNLVKHYLPLANSAWILDNSISGSSKLVVKKRGINQGLIIEEPNIWKTIQEVAYAQKT